MENQNKIYVHNVDVLRGVFAFLVMMYHVLYNEKFFEIERIAFFAVYGFFVISGFSLYVTYKKIINNIDDIKQYIIRRIFRIAPLYIFCMILTLFLTPVPDQIGFKIFLNTTLMFGFLNPGATSLVGGGWSIGIEIVFYCIFPVILASTRRSLTTLVTLAVFSIISMIIFANVVLAGHNDMSTVWTAYTQPIAFWGYFVAGCLLGEMYIRYGSINRAAWLPLALLLGAVAPFLLVQVDQTNDLVRGWTGLLLMAATIVLVGSVSFLPGLPGAAHRAGRFLGDISYGVYLLHGLISYRLLIANVGSPALRVVLVPLLSIALAAATMYLLERPMRQWGRALTRG